MSGTTFLRGENPLKADKLNAAFSERVWRRGDTMQGMLTLWQDPINPFDAATKQYVDTRFSVFPPGSLDGGGTLNGPLYFTATGGTVPRSAQDRAGETVSVLDYGAKCDGATDDTAAVNAALTSGKKVVTIPPNVICYLPNGISVPRGVHLKGMSFQPNNHDTGYAPNSMIMTNANVNCVTLTDDGIGGVRGTTLSDLLIATNNTARPVAGSGVLVHIGYNCRVERVMVYNCYDGFNWGSAGFGGISGWLEDCFSGKISGHHVVCSGWPEMHIHACRFGMNGEGDLGAIAYLYMCGNGAGTMQITNCQFNEFGGLGGPVGALLLFANMTIPSTAQLICMDSCHAEVCDTIVKTDNTLTNMYNVRFSNSTLWPGNHPFFSLDPATTTITNLLITDCCLLINNITLNNTLVNCVIDGNIIQGHFTLGPASNGTLSAAGNNITGNMILTGDWTALFVSGVAGGAFGITATGAVNVMMDKWAEMATALQMKGTAPQIVIGGNSSTGEQRLLFNSVAGQIRDIGFQTAGQWRWWMGANDTAESGANAGSDFVLNAFNDAGAHTSTPITVARATGAVTLSGDLTATGLTSRSGISLQGTGTDTGSFFMATTGNGADQNLWDARISATSLIFRAINDAVSAANTWLQVDRSGYAINQISLGQNGGDVIIGRHAANFLTATRGFLVIPYCAGTPTGVPVNNAPGIPMQFDVNTNKLWAYVGGSWKSSAAFT